MRKRIAEKIYIAVGAYKNFETNRQPYTPNQQRKAIKRLIPYFLRPKIRICNKVKDPKAEKMPWEK